MEQPPLSGKRTRDNEATVPSPTVVVEDQEPSNNNSSSRHYYNRPSVVLQAESLPLLPDKRRKWIPSLRAIWSIRVLIVVILVAAVVATGLSIWVTNYSLSQKGVRMIASKATQFSMEHIATNIRKNIDQGPITTIISVNQIAWGLKLHNGLPGNETIMLALFRDLLWSTNVVTLMFGTANGYYLGLENFAYNKTFHVFKAVPETRILQTYSMDKDTLALTPGSEPDIQNWKVTERAFFSTPAKSKLPEWTIYFAARHPAPRLQLTFSVPIVDPASGQVAAIIAAAFDMAEINRYLARLQLERQQKGSFFDQDGLIYVMETDGFLIGTSVGDTANISVPERYRADQHSEPRIRASATEVLRRFSYQPPLNETRIAFGATIDGKKHLINALTLLPSPKTVWWIVNIYPEMDITESVVTANRVALGISIAALVISLVVALLLGCAITTPLRKISIDMNHVANMELDPEKKSSHANPLNLYEIEQMNSSMNQMKHGLSNFQKYVPSDLVSLVLRKNREIALGVVPRYMSVMFVDIKDFTTIAESFKDKTHELISLMTDFFTYMSNIVMEHGGVIDKYLGDGMMCLFNAPCTLENHEEQAVRAALTMMDRLRELNESWTKAGLPQIQIRVGINSDNCLVGNVGSTSRFDYTALGDPVNVASRLEGLNKRYGTSIIIGENTHKALRGQDGKELFACRWLSFLAMKGKSKPMHIYEVVCDIKDASNHLSIECGLHEQLRAFLDSTVEEAVAIRNMQGICRALMAMNGSDVAARELLERVSDPCFSRSNVYIMTEK